MDIANIKCGLKLVYMGVPTPELVDGAIITVREIQEDLEPANSQVFVCHNGKKCLKPVLPCDLIEYNIP